jgi:hypothetical protein
MVGSALLYPEYSESCLTFLRLIPIAASAALTFTAAILAIYEKFEKSSKYVNLPSKDLRDVHIHLTAGLEFNHKRQLSDYLDEYLGKGEVKIPFGGRQSELSELFSWLEDNKRKSYYLLASPSGRGKSALITRWISNIVVKGEWRVVFLPISIRFSTSSPLNYFKILANRLEQAFDDPVTVDPNATTDIWLNICYRYLNTYSIKNKKKIIIVIDGLDESSDQDWRIWRGLFPKHTPGLPVVISARYIHDDNSPLGWKNRLGLSNDSVIQELGTIKINGVKEILYSLGDVMAELTESRSFQNDLYSLTQGDPLLLRFYISDFYEKMIDEGVVDTHSTTDKFRSIVVKAKPELSGYFELWWDDQITSWREQGKDVYSVQIQFLELLRVLSIAKGPLFGDDLEYLLSSEISDFSVINLLIKETPRIIIGRASTGITLCHPKFRNYFVNEDQISRKKLRILQERFISYGQIILEKLERKQLYPHEVSPYLLNHFRDHLLEGYKIGFVSVDQIFQLRNRGWMEAHDRVIGSPSSFLEDVSLIWKTVTKIEGNAILWQLWCSLVFSSVYSLSNNLSSELIKSFLSIEIGEEKFFSVNQVISYLQLINDNKRKTEIILAVLETQINNDDKQKIIQIALDTQKTLVGKPRVDFLLKLSRFLPKREASSVVNEALTIAKTLDPRYEGSYALECIVEFLPIHQAFSVAQQIENIHSRKNALVDIVGRFPVEKAKRFSQRFDDDYFRAKSMIKVIPYLSFKNDSLFFEETVNTILKTTIAQGKISFIAEITSYLPEELINNIVHDVLNNIGGCHDHIQAGLLKQFALCLPTEQALFVARKIDAVYDRASVLAEIALRLPADQIPKILDEALCAARNHKNPEVRARSLCKIYDCLPNEFAHEILEEALGEAWLIDEYSTQGVVLSIIAARLPANDAFELSKQIEYSVYRALSFVEVAFRLSGEKRKLALDYALNATRYIGDGPHQAEALTKIASRLPEHHFNTIRQETSNLINRIEGQSFRDMALLLIARNLPNGLSQATLDEIISATKDIDVQTYRAEALIEILTQYCERKLSISLEDIYYPVLQNKNEYARDHHLMSINDLIPVGLVLSIIQKTDEAFSRDHDLARLARFFTFLNTNKNEEKVKEGLDTAWKNFFKSGNHVHIANIIESASELPKYEGNSNIERLCKEIAHKEESYLFFIKQVYHTNKFPNFLLSQFEKMSRLTIDNLLSAIDVLIPLFEEYKLDSELNLSTFYFSLAYPNRYSFRKYHLQLICGFIDLFKRKLNDEFLVDICEVIQEVGDWWP